MVHTRVGVAIMAWWSSARLSGCLCTNVMDPVPSFFLSLYLTPLYLSLCFSEKQGICTLPLDWRTVSNLYTHALGDRSWRVELPMIRIVVPNRPSCADCRPPSWTPSWGLPRHAKFTRLEREASLFVLAVPLWKRSSSSCGIMDEPVSEWTVQVSFVCIRLHRNHSS